MSKQDLRIDYLMKMARVEGFLGMYQGAAVNLTLVTPEKAIKLAANDFFQQLLMEDGQEQNLKMEMIAGCGAGMSHMVVTCPMEMFKIQLQDAGRLAVHQGSASVPSSSRSYASGSACEASKHNHPSATLIAWELLHTQGLPGLYKGLGATLLRIGQGTWKTSFKPSPVAKLMSIGCSAAQRQLECPVYKGLWIIFLKTRIQTLKKGLGEDNYSRITAPGNSGFRRDHLPL